MPNGSSGGNQKEVCNEAQGILDTGDRTVDPGISSVDGCAVL